MVCFQETSQTRAAVREVKELQSCQLYPAKSNSGLRETCQISAAGSAGDRKLQADHADEIGSTTCHFKDYARAPNTSRNSRVKH